LIFLHLVEIIVSAVFYDNVEVGKVGFEKLLKDGEKRFIGSVRPRIIIDDELVFLWILWRAGFRWAVR